MCGRYRLSRRKQLVEEYFDTVPSDEEWGPALQHRPRQFGGQLRHKLRHNTAFSKKRPRCKLRERLVGERGFEPPTPWSRTRCSTRLSHSPTALRAATRKAILPHALLLFTSRWAPRL